jgi:hypothetical protein
MAVAGTARLDATAHRRTFKNYADVTFEHGHQLSDRLAGAAIRGLDAKFTPPRWRGFTASAAYKLFGRASCRSPADFSGRRASDALDSTERVPIAQDQRHTARARRISFTRARGPRRWSAMAAACRWSSSDVDLDDLVDHFGQRWSIGWTSSASGSIRRWRSTGGGRRVVAERRTAARMRAEVANLMDRLNVVNFAGLFSGTALAPPRSASVRVRLDF